VYRLYIVKRSLHNFERQPWVDKRPPGYESQSNHLTGSCRPIADD